jgi:hypothetical protein
MVPNGGTISCSSFCVRRVPGARILSNKYHLQIAGDLPVGGQVSGQSPQREEMP